MRLFLILIALVASLGPAAHARQDRVLVIYNHGTGHERDCNFWRRAPKWIQDLDGRRLGGKKVVVSYLCTEEDIDPYESAAQVCDLNVCRRATKIAARIEQAVRRGYPRSQIFLAGQSAGAWASLLVKRAGPESFNGLLLTAPAYGGKRDERLCVHADCGPVAGEDAEARKLRLAKPHRASARRHMNARLADGAALDALIVTFHCDAYGEGWELPTECNPSVTRHEFPPVGPPLPASCPRQAPLSCVKPQTRYFEGAPRRFCAEQKGRIPAGTPACNIKRIENCPAPYEGLCGEKAHSFFLRQPFSNWVAQSDMAARFIEERLANWQYGTGDAPSETPCGFTASLPECRP